MSLNVRHSCEIVKGLLKFTSVINETNAKTEKLDFIKLMNSLAAKKTMNIVKRSWIELKNICISYKSDKGFKLGYMKNSKSKYQIIQLKYA